MFLACSSSSTTTEVLLLLVSRSHTTMVWSAAHAHHAHMHTGLVCVGWASLSAHAQEVIREDVPKRLVKALWPLGPIKAGPVWKSHRLHTHTLCIPMHAPAPQLMMTCLPSCMG